MPDTQSVEPLMDLRLAYLRAVAKAWQDSAYRDTLLAAKDIQPMLQELGMKSWWPNLDFRVVNNPLPAQQTRWDPVQTLGWVGQDDRFEIALPQAPKDPAQAAIALAAYYQQFPDVMGPLRSAVAASSNTGSSNLLGGAVNPDLGIPGGGPDSLLAFGGVVLRAVALGWHDPAFLSQLIGAGNEAELVLSQWLGYNNPFNFQIRFVAAPSFTWDADKGAWNGISGDLPEVKNAIVLNYPNAPEDQGLRPIALTSYNNTGPAYPFTC